MTDPVTRCRTFGDIISIVERRGRIKGSVQDVDRNLVKGYINEYYVSICNLRKWQWRNFERTFIIKPAINSEDTVGYSADVTEDDRKVKLNGITIDASYKARSIRFNEQEELYRIIGVNVATNEIYLESNYVEDTEAGASFKIYQYEFGLPPDCDSPNQLWLMRDSYTPEGELEYKTLLEYNRMLSSYNAMVTVPRYYCVDGKTWANLSMPPLDRMLLDWDFLGGEDTDKTEKLRIYPLESDKPRVIHMSYTILVKEMEDETEEPMIPIDNRWCLVHYALYEHFKTNGQMVTASKEKADGDNMVRIMANEFRKTQTKPKFIYDARGGHREHIYGRGKRLLNISG